MRITERDALIAVDIQNDFVEGGALGVSEGHLVVPVVNELLPLFVHVVFTRDWHPPGHVSFAGRPSFQDGSWPAHCVQNTTGAEFHQDLLMSPHAHIVSKATSREREEYSAFQAVAGDLAGWLRARGVVRVFLAGIATDYCVRFTALDAAREGFETYVIEDAVRGVAPETVQQAWEEMTAAGIRRIRSSEMAAVDAPRSGGQRDGQG